MTFLVRREQATEVKLYSYDKKKTFTYGDIKSLSTELLEEKEEVEKIEGSEAGTNQAVEDPFAAFDLVILTLPSDVLYSEAGVTLMKRLNSRLQKSAIYVVLPPGFGMQERVFTPAGITRAQIAYGLPLFLCHDVSSLSDCSLLHVVWLRFTICFVDEARGSSGRAIQGA